MNRRKSESTTDFSAGSPEGLLTSEDRPDAESVYVLSRGTSGFVAPFVFLLVAVLISLMLVAHYASKAKEQSLRADQAEAALVDAEELAAEGWKEVQILRATLVALQGPLEDSTAVSKTEGAGFDSLNGRQISDPDGQD